MVPKSPTDGALGQLTFVLVLSGGQKEGLLQKGKGLLLMVSLVIISTIDLDDWLPASRAPSLFVFAPQDSRKKEWGQGVGTLERLSSST